MHNWRALAIDPLWQCLCPAATQRSIARPSALVHRLQRPRPCVWTPQCQRQYSYAHRGFANAFHPDLARARRARRARDAELEHLNEEDTPSLHGRLRAAAVDANARHCRVIAEHLVKERREQTNISLYNALILSNVDHEHGAAWRVAELLEEMRADSLQPDGGTCHAVLKVLAIHPDHLLRTDILEYMRKRWFTLSEDGAHDVVAGLLREGLFEQALQQLDNMKARMPIDPWLWDMAVYIFCQAGEIDEAYRIMQSRFNTGEMNISKSVWAYLLDKASEARHHDAASLAWTSQVKQSYINPPSGTCLNVLATAARAGDAALGTEVFAHLSKRGTAYQPIHYELLISTYLSAEPPDIKRAMSILTIMPLEKLEPTPAETRGLFLYLRDKPPQVKQCLMLLRELHDQGRKIPIAALNLLIECHIEQNDLAEAIKIYKLIHTFVPIGKGAQKSFANIDTFNLLLKGCRLTTPPDEQQASFLVSELLALRVIPTALTYDRLILVFVESAKIAWRTSNLDTPDSAASHDQKAKARELLDWAFRHFADMQPLGWMPRFGTVELLAAQLAAVGDDRCWDVLQMAEDQGQDIEGFGAKGKWLRTNVESAWQKGREGKKEGIQASVSEETVRV